jgi:hypothetical protein
MSYLDNKLNLESASKLYKPKKNSKKALGTLINSTGTLKNNI